MTLRRRTLEVTRAARRLPSSSMSPSVPAHVKLAWEAWAHGAIQKPAELAELLALLQERPPRTVVEIGTAGGGTFYAWCRVADPAATIVSIDLPGGAFGGGYAPGDLPKLRSYGLPDQTLHFIRADSHAPSTCTELERVLDGSPIDFLMIDGDHSYEGVRADFELYSPLVRAGAMIAFHDIVPNPSGDGGDVERFWSELRETRPHLELVDTYRSGERGFRYGGIGVVYA
jgi:cephalosporin hydroxylase